MRLAARVMVGVICTVAAAAGLQAEGPGPEQVGPRRRVLAGNDGMQIGIEDAGGKLLFSHKLGSIHDAQILDDGHLLFQTDYQHLLETDRDGKAVWQYDATKQNNPDHRPVQVHGFQRLAGGLTMIAESGRGRIIEVDHDGNIRHEIKLKLNHPSTHSDTRRVRVLADGHYLVAHEADGAVREYDRSGNVVWEFDVPLFGRKPAGGHGPEAFGNHCFMAVRLGSGNTLIATGNGHSVIEVTPDKRIVWKVEQHDLPGITLAWVTELQPLANGDVIFGNCHAGPGNPQLIEVTREKKVVWTWRDFRNFGNATPVAVALDEQDRPLK